MSPSIFLGLFVLIVSDEAASAIRRESTPLLKKKRKKKVTLYAFKRKRVILNDEIVTLSLEGSGGFGTGN